MNRRGILGAAFAGMGLALAACQSNGEGDGGGVRTGNDAEGAVLIDAVRIAKIDRSTVNQDGKVRYWVDNISGTDQDDLAWSVSFLFPPQKSDVSVTETAETTSERSLTLLRGDANKLLEAQCGAFAEMKARGQPVLGTRLNVAFSPPVMTLARDANTAGTRFLGKIECVGQSNVWEGDQLVLEFENITNAKVSDLELQVVFVDTRAKSKWRAIPAMGPGQRAKVAVDLKGLDMGSRDFLVKVRQQAL